jgi:hypothetical protein
MKRIFCYLVSLLKWHDIHTQAIDFANGADGLRAAGAMVFLCPAGDRRDLRQYLWPLQRAGQL